MTQTMSPYHVIFKAEPGYTDAAFTIEELKDIVNHGMSAGVSGFIYTRQCCEAFDEHEDDIETYLSDWYHDNMNEDNYIGAIAGAENNHSYPVASIDELKNRMVWAYVELMSFEILSENGYDF